MSGVLDRLKKKRGYPVEIDGDTYYVRSLTIGELKRLADAPAEQKTGFVLGCALCSDSSGVAEFLKLDGESDTAWADRVMSEIADVPTETIRALSSGVANISKTPRVEVVAKN